MKSKLEELMKPEPTLEEVKEEFLRKMHPDLFDPNYIEMDKLLVFIEAYRKTRDLRIADIIVDSVDSLLSSHKKRKKSFLRIPTFKGAQREGERNE